MDTLETQRLIEALIKDFETSETHSILFYSQDQPRDFRLLADKVKEYREKFNVLLAHDGKGVPGEIRDSIRT